MLGNPFYIPFDARVTLNAVITAKCGSQSKVS